MGQLKEIAEMSEPEQMYSSGEKQSLLKKFDIPVQHFDFPYIEQCTDDKELEKILQVLKSGEEGYYPQLIEKTEERLAKLKPNSIHIRKVTPILTKNDIDNRFSQEITLDLNNWLDDINKKNNELSQTKNIMKSNFPEVRKSVVSQEKKENISTRIKSTDYAAWDKYDPDTEILKMDLEEEKLKKDAEKLGKEKEKPRTVKFNKFTTSAEASFEAQRENIIGNEYFRAEEYKSALEHYNNAITFYPTGTSYANRASAYFKLKKYKEAISDYKDALKYQPNSYDYILQMGRCYNSLEMWSEALECAETVIKSDPNSKGAQKLAERVKKCGDKIIRSNKVRFKIVEVEDKPTRIPKKSILKKESEIIPIPGSSKTTGPYYKVVYSQDPQVIEREKQMINNYPKKIFMTNIDFSSDDDDGDCLETHIKPTNFSPGKISYVSDNNNNRNNSNTKNNLEYDNNEKNKMYNKAVISENKQSKTLQPTKSAEIIESNKETNIDKNIVTKKEDISKVACEYSKKTLQLTKSEEINKEVNNDKNIVIKKEDITKVACDYSKKNIESDMNEISSSSKTKLSQTNEVHLQTAESFPQNDIIMLRNTHQNVANHSDIGGGGEPYVENNRNEVNPVEVNMPFSFVQAWQSVRRDGTHSGFATILRNLNINRITEVIGNKIDATILSEILNCLYRHFMVADEVDNVYNILLNLCRLQRFGIVIMFLSADDKRLVHNLLDFLKQHGREMPENVRREYV